MPASSRLEETLSIHRSAHALRPEQFVNTPSHKCDGFSTKPRSNLPASRPKASSWPHCPEHTLSGHALQRGARIHLSPERDSPRRAISMERAMGIEPTSSAWKAVALPLSYARILQPIYEMFPSQARQFVLVLFPHRRAAFSASCLHRDTVEKSRLPGKHLFVKSRFFWSSRSSATSFPFNLPGNPPSREFSRPTA